MGGVRRLLLISVVVSVGVFVAPAWAVVVPSFTYAPTGPFTGQTITFTSMSTGATSIAWDLDGDGFCDDASGPTATASFAAAGIYAVTVCADDNGTPPPAGTQTQNITVHNRPPTALFTIVPAHPVADEPVVFTSTAFDPDGPIVTQLWDLDGDGAYDDHSGDTALKAWPKAGTYSVGLRVTDRDGAAAVVRASVVVAKKPAKRFGRTPLVRVVSRPTATGAHLDLLTVSAPRGAKINVRCHGHGCPYRSKSTVSKGKTVTLRKMSRSFKAGAVIEIRVTKADTIGKFTRIRIHARGRPGRVDRCLEPGKPNKPIGCPQG
jgi:PKD repeat protein